MKKLKRSLSTAFLLFGFVIAFAQQERWKATEDYTIKFSGKKVEGVFRGLEVNILFDPKDPSASRIAGGINVNTLNTGIGLKNKHAKSETGLYAEKFPAITFISTQIVKTATGYEASGNLTIKGMSKSVKLPFTFERTQKDAVFRGTFTVKPQEYNVTRSGTPDLIEVQITLRVVPDK